MPYIKEDRHHHSARLHAASARCQSQSAPGVKYTKIDKFAVCHKFLTTFNLLVKVYNRDRKQYYRHKPAAAPAQV